MATLSGRQQGRGRAGRNLAARAIRRIALAACSAAMLTLAACSSGAGSQPVGPDNPTEGVVTLPPAHGQSGQEQGGQSGAAGSGQNSRGGQGSLSTGGEGARPSVRQATPGTEGTCPYLSAEEAGDATGEKVTRVDIDTSFNPPACIFTSIDGSISLITTMHKTDSPEQARALVDDAAPPASTERADFPGGWTGGKSTGAFGSLLAVARGSDVVVVQSTQDRSMAVQRVAELVVPRMAGN